MSKYDTIVALGGGIAPNGRLANSSRHRINMAIALYCQGLAPNIVASGRWSYRLENHPPITEATAMKRHALARSVGETAIHTEELSADTIGNAYFTKRLILERRGWRSLAVVTCLEHAARTQLIFERILGPEYSVSVYPTLELPDRDARSQADRRLAVTAQELSHIAQGDDQALAEQFHYLKSLDMPFHSFAGA